MPINLKLAKISRTKVKEAEKATFVTGERQAVPKYLLLTSKGAVFKELTNLYY